MNENRTPGAGKSPKKTPRFSFYWIYAIVFAVLIGMQLFGPLAPNMAKSNEKEFKQLVIKGQVEKYQIIDNRNTVRVFLNDSGLVAQAARLKEIGGKVTKQGPHMSFRITGGEAFQKSMSDLYTKNPAVAEIAFDVDNERDWFGGILQFLLPVLLFVGIWVLFMRKMGGPAGGGGGGSSRRRSRIQTARRTGCESAPVEPANRKPACPSNPPRCWSAGIRTWRNFIPSTPETP